MNLNHCRIGLQRKLRKFSACCDIIPSILSKIDQNIKEKGKIQEISYCFWDKYRNEVNS